MRIINADELEKKMYHEAFEVDSELQMWNSGCWIRYKLFEKCLENTPTIDDADRPQAEWTEDEEGYWRCTNCGRKAEWEFFEDNYCPRCGARMK